MSEETVGPAPADAGSAPAPAPAPAPELQVSRVAVMALLFFCSGATGLVYEVAWSKRLELTFGSSSHSIGIVLAAYMAGLGLGAWLLGRWADRPGSPARRYALLEAGVGCCALLAPWLLDAMDALYVALGGAGGLFTKGLLGLVTILPATLLMGGTLPVLARSLVDRGGDTQRAVGLLYGFNTLGAVVGTLLSGLWLLHTLGMDHTSRIVGLINLTLAGAALLLGPRLAPDVGPAAARAPLGSSPDGPEARARRGQLALWATFGCGLVALALEVAWTRALGLAFGSTGHGFTIMLAATLLGIGLGSLLAARVSQDERTPLRGLVVALLVLAAANFLFLSLYELLPRFFFVLAQTRYLYYEQLLLVLFVVATAALLPATTALGVAFPCCTQLGTPAAGEAGERVGRIYLANTLGAIAGSLLGAFAFVSWLGTEGTIRAGACASGLGAAWLAWEARRTGGWTQERARALAALGGALAAAALLPPLMGTGWDPSSLDLAPTRLLAQPVPAQPGSYENAFHHGGSKLLYRRDGLNAYVSVRYTGRATSLMLGGKADASTLGDMSTQLLCGVLPFLAHPQAKRTLVIGAGSGVTVRVVSDFPSVERLDLIEIEPAVVEAARLHFGSVNDGALDRPEVRIVYEDARSFLLCADERQPWDVIVAEPTNPWIAGVANMFTLEHYRNAARVLAEDGVYLQWVQLYESDEWMARSMLRTVCQAFEHVDLFWANPGDLLLLASKRPLRYDLAAIRQVVSANPGLMRDLWPRMHARAPDELLARYLMPGTVLAQLVQGGEVLHDRYPRLEAGAARARYESFSANALQRQLWEAHLRLPELTPALTGPERPDPIALRVAFGRQLAELSLDGHLHDLLSGVDHPEALAMLAHLEPDPDRHAAALLDALARHPGSPELLLELALMHVQRGQLDQARLRLAELSLLPGPRRALYYLLRGAVLDRDRREGAEEAVRLAEEGLAVLMPRETEMDLRRQLLSQIADCAPRAPRAVEVLSDYVRARGGDDEGGLSLARALLAVNRPADALDVLARMEDPEAGMSMGWVVSVRLLRLHALQLLRDEPAWREELRRFLRDFPGEAVRPEVIRMRLELGRR